MENWKFCYCCEIFTFFRVLIVLCVFISLNDKKIWRTHAAQYKVDVEKVKSEENIYEGKKISISFQFRLT